jgi:shikimate dehydrogenase
MHNAGLAALGLDWRYVAFDVEPEQLEPAIGGAASMRFIGLNLTVPHKLLAVDLVDELDESARKWGAVNTIVFEGADEAGGWKPLREFDATPPGRVRSHGFNTDAEAITRALWEDLRVEVKGARILVLGAGGAGRTAALKFASDHAGELHLVNRTAARGAAVVSEIRERYPAVAVSQGYPAGAVDLVVNATSVGLRAGDGLPFDTGAWSLDRAGAVYDMIYRPAITPLLKAAKAAGCRTANGLGMLLYQGAKALELWTGRPAPIDEMREALRRNIYG